MIFRIWDAARFLITISQQELLVKGQHIVKALFISRLCGFLSCLLSNSDFKASHLFSELGNAVLQGCFLLSSRTFHKVGSDISGKYRVEDDASYHQEDSNAASLRRYGVGIAIAHRR